VEGGILTAAGAPRRYAHGEVILGQGEPVSCLRLVSEGAVRLSAVAPSGREVVVAVLGRGDVFGEVALLGSGPSPVEARALGHASVVLVPVESIRTVVRSSPATAEELLRLVAVRLHRTSAALEEALANDVPARVCLRLRALARSHGTPSKGGVRLPPRLTQEELARMVGATRESVNRSLGSLAARGLVRIEGRRYVLPDPDALVTAASAELDG
jgi:CRP-like cAMP-binding protein